MAQGKTDMIKYPHFALDNLFLGNGYRETHIDEDVVREYEREEELEQCIRRLVLRKPEPLRGWDLRFLRRGLELSQADFGAMVDRDAQTVARWEKSKDLVPKFVDLMIRARFAERFEPKLEVTKLLSFIDGTAPALPKQIPLFLSTGGWSFLIVEEVKVLGTGTVVNVVDANIAAFSTRLDKPNMDVVFMHSVGATTEETSHALWSQGSTRTKPASSATGRKRSIHFTPGNC